MLLLLQESLCWALLHHLISFMYDIVVVMSYVIQNNVILHCATVGLGEVQQDKTALGLRGLSAGSAGHHLRAIQRFCGRCHSPIL